MFENPAPRVKAPEGPRAFANVARQPRPKKRQFYVFKDTEDPNIREIVQSVSNGLDASLISPKLYPTIFRQLQAEELRLKYSNPCASASLHNAIEMINNWKPESVDDQTAVDSHHENIFLPSQEMIDEGVEYALDGRKEDLLSIDPQLLQFLILPLREIRKKSLENGDYKMAQKAESGVKLVFSQQTLQVKMEEEDEKSSEYQQRLEIAQIQLDNVKEKWQILIEQKRQMMEDDMVNKQEEFNIFLESYDKQFDNEPPPKALKLSPMALDMKAKEKFLVSAKRFDDAKKMRELANIREKQEIRLKKEQYYNDLMKERDKLIEKERQKNFIAEMNWQNSISQMQLTANQEIAHAQKTVDHLVAIQRGSGSDTELSNSSRKLPPLNISRGHSDAPRTVNTVR